MKLKELTEQEYPKYKKLLELGFSVNENLKEYHQELLDKHGVKANRMWDSFILRYKLGE